MHARGFEEHLEYLAARVTAAVKNAQFWWDCLGKDTPVRQEVEAKGTVLRHAGLLPQIVPSELVVPADVPERVRVVSTWLMQKFPRLVKYAPEIWPSMVQRCLEAALCTDWERAGETLERQIQSYYGARDVQTRAEVWWGHWESDGRLVLTKPIYRDPHPMRIHEPFMVVVGTWWPEQRPEEFDQAMKRGRDAAWTFDGRREPPALVGVPRGTPEQYDRMVDAYHAWIEAGAPGTRSRPGTVPGYTDSAGRRLLKKAIDWLQPEEVEDLSLDL